MGTEIERKWLLTEDTFNEVMKMYPNAETTNIIQSYISIENPEVRLRIEGEDYFLTVKSEANESGKKRSEHQINLTRDQYNELIGAVTTDLVLKERYRIPLERHVVDLDDYHGKLGELFIAEVEFETEEEADNFKPPEWLSKSKEVTEDKRFKNKQLAKIGLPEGI